MRRLHELLAYPKLKIVQDDELFKFSIDALLLASFIKTNSAKKIMDFCTGNGPIAMYLTLKTDALIYGCDIELEPWEMAKESVILNRLEDQVFVYNTDLIDISKKGIDGITANSFDIVCANPPYFPYAETSHINANLIKAVARHEIKVKMEDIIVEATRLLIDGGSLYLMYKPSRVDELTSLLDKHNFGIKDMRFVYSKEGEDALLVMVEAKKNRGKDIKVLGPLYIYDNDNYSKEVLDIFNLGKEE